MKILIVDDEEPLLKLYTILITRDIDCEVETARNGEEAVEKYKGLDEKPDIVLMDYWMPVKNGVQATMEILEFDSEAVIVFISADDKKEKEALESGAVSFIKKPFNPPDLLQLIYGLSDIIG